MTTLAEVATLLGVARPAVDSPLKFVDMIDRGLPRRALDRLCMRLAPEDASFKYRIVPKATLARYSVRLSAAQSTLVARLADIWALALGVWRSDDAARDFLFRPHQLLEGRRPIDVALENELGGQLVREILGRLQHGSAV
jgi:putative toxin-antitoxin system antitoxin component (TIGR02293 family)